MHSGEVICIHLGQAGVQMGQAAWELLAAEHGIKSNGTKKESSYEEGSDTTFFQETPSGQYVPRSLFIDLEPTVIDEIRVGNFGRFFHPDLMVTGMEDSGSNYARARYARGLHIIPLVIDKIRYVAESCDGLQGFMLFSSFGGGTGSGLGALFLNRLEHEFHRRPRIHVGIFPGPDLSPAVVEPYNSTLFSSDLLEQADLSILLDNTALCNAIKAGLRVDKPSYVHLNRLSAQIISHLTSTLRFPNSLNNSLHEMQINLIPYPQIKFPVSAFSPIHCIDRNRHDTMATEALTRSLFTEDNLMVSCDLKRGLFMANSMIYRGPFDPVSVNQTITCIKRDSNWVTWCPTGFKIGLSNQKPLFLNSSLMAPSDRSVFMISNTTAVRQVIQKLSRQFGVLYAKKAFVHHYINEGLDEDEMKQAFEDVSNLETLYREIQEIDSDDSCENFECTSNNFRDTFLSVDASKALLEKQLSKELMVKDSTAGKSVVGNANRGEIQQESNLNNSFNNNYHSEHISTMEPNASVSNRDNSNMNGMDTVYQDPCCQIETHVEDQDPRCRIETHVEDQESCCQIKTHVEDQDQRCQIETHVEDQDPCCQIETNVEDQESCCHIAAHEQRSTTKHRSKIFTKVKIHLSKLVKW